MVLFVDLAQVAAVSIFALLFYYVFANVCALRLKVEKRQYPRVLPVLGLCMCLALLVVVFFANLQAWVTGVACLGIGALVYVAKKRFKPSKECES